MTLTDLDKLIRLESFRNDEAESRHEVILNDLRDKSDGELRDLIEQELTTLKQIEKH